jgi:hypothetical protein
MKLIAHRGNIKGPNPLEENNPRYIEKALDKEFHVEIDIRFDQREKKLYLGHDEPQYVVDWIWLEKYKDFLWIHCKNIESLYQFVCHTSGFNYFWHQEDDFTLTSKNYIWTYPGKSYTPKSVIVMPENSINRNNFDTLKFYNCFGVCSDYIGDFV